LRLRRGRETGYEEQEKEDFPRMLPKWKHHAHFSSCFRIASNSKADRLKPVLRVLMRGRSPGALPHGVHDFSFHAVGGKIDEAIG
jgi:hypothetical protein